MVRPGLGSAVVTRDPQAGLDGAAIGGHAEGDRNGHPRCLDRQRALVPALAQRRAKGVPFGQRQGLGPGQAGHIDAVQRRRANGGRGKLHRFGKIALRGISAVACTRHRPRQGRGKGILRGRGAGAAVDHLAVATHGIPGRGGIGPVRPGRAILRLAQRIFQGLLARGLGSGLFPGLAVGGGAFLGLALGCKTALLCFPFCGLGSGAAFFLGLALRFGPTFFLGRPFRLGLALGLLGPPLSVSPSLGFCLAFGLGLPRLLGQAFGFPFLCRTPFGLLCLSGRRRGRADRSRASSDRGATGWAA